LEPYSPLLLEHFRNPRNVGEVDRPDAGARVENALCGDVLRLTVTLDEGRITNARFQCRGCVVAIAAGSVVTDLLPGKTVAEALALRESDLEAVLGSAPAGRRPCLSLAREAVLAALKGHPS
jgi:nitrogen fixation protein NifU and related proteins